MLRIEHVGTVYNGNVEHDLEIAFGTTTYFWGCTEA